MFQPRLWVRLFFEFGIAKYVKIWYTGGDEPRDQADGAGITDTFAYDTYGKMTSRTGTTPIIFGYNGKHGVVTDANGLLYMRARYYSPAMRRFVNADVIPGNISKAVTLNRYAFANGNPVLFIDPLGLSAEGYTKEDVQQDLNLVYSGLMSDQEFTDKYGFSPDQASTLGAATVSNSQVAKRQNVNNKKYNINWEQFFTNKKNKDDDLNGSEDKIQIVEPKKKDVLEPLVSAIEPFAQFLAEADRLLDRYNFSSALYDNRRVNKDALFHEQFLAINISMPSLGFSDEVKFGLGSISADAFTGGWEGQYVDFSLLDFFHAEASAEIKDYTLSLGAMASIWSPSLAVDVFGITIEIGAEVGAVGASVEIGPNSVSTKVAGAVGFSFNISW